MFTCTTALSHEPCMNILFYLFVFHQKPFLPRFQLSVVSVKVQKWLLKVTCPYPLKLCTHNRVSPLVRSSSIRWSILTKPNCVEKSQIYESESEMEEFPHDYFWVSLKNFWLFGPLHEKLQLFWDLIRAMDCLWASSLNENEIVKDAYGWCLEISMT